MRRSVSAPSITHAALEVPEPPRRPRSLPETSTERPNALVIDWGLAAPVFIGTLNSRYKERGTRKVVAFSADRASDTDFQAFREDFVQEPEKALQHLIKVTADVEPPPVALDLAVSKLPKTPAAREHLLEVLTGDAITNSFLRTAQAHPRLVRSALKLKRAVYLRLVTTGRAARDRHLVDRRDRAVAMKGLGHTELTNAQLLIDIAFLRLNPAYRALAVSALSEIWTDDKEAVGDLLAEAMLWVNAKLMGPFEKYAGVKVERPTATLRESAHGLVAKVWDEALLINLLAQGTHEGPDYAARLARLMRGEVSRLQNFQTFIEHQLANVTPNDQAEPASVD